MRPLRFARSRRAGQCLAAGVLGVGRVRPVRRRGQRGLRRCRGSVADLCAVVEAARALVPGPVATTALATIVVTDPVLLQAFASGHRTAGVTVDADLSEDSGRVSGSVDYVLGAGSDGSCCSRWGADRAGRRPRRRVLVESLTATDFSRPLARVTLDCVPVTPLSFSRPRFRDLAATVLSAEAAGVARWALDTAAQYAKVREQFGKPIGSFQAVKHLCAEMLLRSQQVSAAAADAAVAATDEINSPSLHRLPRPSASSPQSSTQRPAFRCLAGSASPGSMTRTCICVVRMGFRSSSAVGPTGCAALRSSPCRACAAN